MMWYDDISKKMCFLSLALMDFMMETRLESRCRRASQFK